MGAPAPRPPSRPGARFPLSIAPVSDDATSTPTTDEQLAHLSPEERDVLAKVTEIVRRIQFGTVVLVIQDGKVVQIEMAEKFRLR
jgi:hypothetical protein